MRALIVAALGAGLVLAPSAGAGADRLERAYYLAPGGATLGPSTLYGSTPTGNVGVARAFSRSGDKAVRLTVADSSGLPVALRVETLRAGRIGVLVACAAGTVGPLALKGATEVRVLPLAGACGSGVAASTPTSGEVRFTFTR